MATQLNSIIAELKLLPGAEHLLYAVNPKKVYSMLAMNYLQH